MGRDKEPGQAEMGLTILLMGFRLGGRGAGALVVVETGAAYVRPSQGHTQFLSSLYLGSVVSSTGLRGAIRFWRPWRWRVLAGARGEAT